MLGASAYLAYAGVGPVRHQASNGPDPDLGMEHEVELPLAVAKVQLPCGHAAGASLCAGPATGVGNLTTGCQHRACCDYRLLTKKK